MEARLVTTTHETPDARVTVSSRSSAGTPIAGWVRFPDGFSCRWSRAFTVGHAGIALTNSIGRLFHSPARCAAISATLGTPAKAEG